MFHQGHPAVAYDVHGLLVQVIDQDSLALAREYDRQRQAYVSRTPNDADVCWRLSGAGKWRRFAYFIAIEEQAVRSPALTNKETVRDTAVCKHAGPIDI